MLNRWAPWYKGGTAQPSNYGPVDTYHLAEVFLSGLDVEDWGCGYAHFKTIHYGGYIGIDGTAGYCDIVADLTDYQSDTPAILLRSVLDHNREWRKILTNALASFTRRAAVILFTPDGHDDEIGYVAELDVHDYALPHGEIEDMLIDAGCDIRREFVANDSGYGGETLWYVLR